MPVINRGRIIEFINGIQGVAAGAQAIINLDVNRRYHRIALQCSAVNYTGGTAQATVALTGGGNDDATVTPTIVNGVITAVAVVAGGTGYTTGDTLTITDATGTGFIGTVTAAAGAVTAVAVTSIGTPSAINPATLITSIQQIVNGIIVRDITPDQILRVLSGNSRVSRRGELPLLYTEEFFNVNQLNELLSWDMFGQSTFTLRISISSTVTNPGLNGVQEYDLSRNVRPTPQGLVPFLQPVAQHAFNFNIISGLNKINTIPFDFPIRRMWFLGSTPGNLTQLEIYQDGNKVFEAITEQMQELYDPYGFDFGQGTVNAYLDNSYAASATLIGRYNAPRFWDMAYLSDPDERVGKALSCENSLVVRLTSAIAQSVTVLVESLPGSYAS